MLFMSAVLTQQFCQVVVASTRRFVQRCVPNVVLGIDLAPVRQEALHYLLATMNRRLVQRSFPNFVLGMKQRWDGSW